MTIGQHMTNKPSASQSVPVENDPNKIILRFQQTSEEARKMITDRVKRGGYGRRALAIIYIMIVLFDWTILSIAIFDTSPYMSVCVFYAFFCLANFLLILHLAFFRKNKRIEADYLNSIAVVEAQNIERHKELLERDEHYNLLDEQFRQKDEYFKSRDDYYAQLDSKIHSLNGATSDSDAQPERN